MVVLRGGADLRQREAVRHIETTLARSLYNCDEKYVIFDGVDNPETDSYRAAYSGTALAFRDRLIIDWNKTQQRQTFADQKRIYCKLRNLRRHFTDIHRSLPRVFDGKSS